MQRDCPPQLSQGREALCPGAHLRLHLRHFYSGSLFCKAASESGHRDIMAVSQAPGLQSGKEIGRAFVVYLTASALFSVLFFLLGSDVFMAQL